MPQYGPDLAIFEEKERQVEIVFSGISILQMLSIQKDFTSLELKAHNSTFKAHNDSFIVVTTCCAHFNLLHDH